MARAEILSDSYVKNAHEDMCQRGIVLANWVPWNAAECALLRSDDEFGDIISPSSVCNVSGSTTLTMSKSPCHAAVHHNVVRKNSPSTPHLVVSPIVPVPKTSLFSVVKQHTRSKNHSPFKISMLEASYKRNSNPASNEKKHLAHCLKMSMKQVCNWFSNYRKRKHRHPTPVV